MIAFLWRNYAYWLIDGSVPCVYGDLFYITIVFDPLFLKTLQAYRTFCLSSIDFL